MSSKLTEPKLIEIVLNSLEAERLNDVKMGKALMHSRYRKTSMVRHDGVVFPQISGEQIEPLMKRAYAVKGRKFYIYNVAANEQTQTVFVELAEFEPRPEGDVLWPYTLICTIEAGVIKQTRHYGDTGLLQQVTTLSQIKEAIGDNPFKVLG